MRNILMIPLAVFSLYLGIAFAPGLTLAGEQGGGYGSMSLPQVQEEVRPAALPAEIQAAIVAASVPARVIQVLNKAETSKLRLFAGPQSHGQYCKAVQSVRFKVKESCEQLSLKPKPVDDTDTLCLLHEGSICDTQEIETIREADQAFLDGLLALRPKLKEEWSAEGCPSQYPKCNMTLANQRKPVFRGVGKPIYYCPVLDTFPVSTRDSKPNTSNVCRQIYSQSLYGESAIKAYTTKLNTRTGVYRPGNANW